MIALKVEAPQLEQQMNVKYEWGQLWKKIH